MFWGYVVKQGSDSKVSFVDSSILHLTNVALSPNAQGKCSLFVKTNKDSNKILICTLESGKNEHALLDLYLISKDKPELSASKGEFHVSGYFEPSMEDLDEEESEVAKVAPKQKGEQKKPESKPVVAQPKKEEQKPAQPKKEEQKPAQPKKEEQKPQVKKEEPKPVPKKEEAKQAPAKKDAAKPSEPQKPAQKPQTKAAPAKPVVMEEEDSDDMDDMDDLGELDSDDLEEDDLEDGDDDLDDDLNDDLEDDDSDLDDEEIKATLGKKTKPVAQGGAPQKKPQQQGGKPPQHQGGKPQHGNNNHQGGKPQHNKGHEGKPQHQGHGGDHHKKDKKKNKH